MDKRTFLKAGALTAGAGILGNHFSGNTYAMGIVPGMDEVSDGKEYTLPELPYSYKALEKAIDEQTMRLHHDVHHAGYVKGLNNATDKVNEMMANGDYSLVKHWQRELAFHGSGHFLHTIFWNNMTGSSSSMDDEFVQLVQKSFPNEEAFKDYFLAAASKVEGSGWGILAYQPITDKLVVLQAEKHQNLGQWVSIPVLVVDVWEHAYYLRYQNQRSEYLQKWWGIINWENVSERIKYLRNAFGNK